VRYHYQWLVPAALYHLPRPVIHLATVVHGYLHLVGLAAEVLGALLMTSRPVIEYLIRNAEYCETLVAKSSRLRIDADRCGSIDQDPAGSSRLVL
jgi:hypothetical protein